MFRDRLYLAILSGATAALVLILLQASQLGRDDVPLPDTLHDVAHRATTLGLYHRSDSESGIVGSRLIVSDHPVTFERAVTLRFGDTKHSCWHGTVAACVPWHCYRSFSDPDHGVVWGKVFLFGDPVLIRALTAASPLSAKQVGEVHASSLAAAACWGASVM
jgi:hypothetical protein